MPTITTENSFLTIEDADTMLDDVFSAEGWAALADDTKARLLITATRLLKDLVDEDAVAETTFWTSHPLKLSTALQAWFLYEMQDDLKEAQADGVSSANYKKLGNVALSKGNTGFHWRKQYSPQVLRLLKGYYRTSKTIVRA